MITTVLKSWETMKAMSVVCGAILLGETISPQMILLICETTPFSRVSHLSKGFQYRLTKVENYQSPYITSSTLQIFLHVETKQQQQSQ